MIKYYLTPEAIAAGCEFNEPAQGDAGFDIYAAEGYRIFGNRQQLISTGLHVQIPKGYVGIVKDRSGMALKDCHVLAGVIDSAYRGELKVVLHNFEYSIVVGAGDRIAQLVIVPFYTDYTQQVIAVEFLDHFGSRGYEGFGSSGE